MSLIQTSPLTVVLVLFLLLLVNPSAAKTHKICIITDASQGEPHISWLASALLAVDHVNSKNAAFVPAAATLPEEFKFEAVVGDSQLDESAGLAAGNDCMYRVGVDAIVGTYRSAVSILLAHTAGVLDIPHVSYQSTSVDLTDPIRFPTFFRTCANEIALSRAIVALVAKMKWRRLGVVAPSDQYGTSVTEGLAKAARQFNLLASTSAEQQVLVEGFNHALGDPGDIRAQLTSLRDQGLNIIVASWLNNEDAIDILEIAASLGMLSKGFVWIVNDSITPKGLTELEELNARVGELTQGFLHVASVLVADEGMPAIESAWAAARPRWAEWQAKSAAVPAGEGPMAAAPSDSIAYSYNAVWAMAFALAKVDASGETNALGSASGRAVFASATGEANAFEGMGGRISIDGNGDLSADATRYRISTIAPDPGTGLATFTKVGEVVGSAAAVDAASIMFPGEFAALPIDGFACRDGTVFAAATQTCAYKVSLLIPFAWSDFWKRVTAAVFLAAEHINTRDVSVVPAGAALPEGFQIQPVLFDTLYNVNGGVVAVSAALAEGTTAIVGAARSDTSKAVAGMAGSKGIPQLSYWSISKELSDDATYPYFARTIPASADSDILLSYNKVIAHFGWSKVAILYQEDSFGLSFFSSLQTVGASTGITYVGMPYAVGSLEEITAALEAIAAQGVLVTFFIEYHHPELQHLFLEADRLNLVGPGHVWVSSEYDYTAILVDYPDNAPRLAAAMRGSLRILPDGANSTKWSVINGVVKERGADLLPPHLRDAVASGGSLQEASQGTQPRDPRAFYSEGLSGFEIDTASYAYDAVWAVALGIAEVDRNATATAADKAGERTRVSVRGRDIMDAILDLAFEGVTGRAISFTDKGDRDLRFVEKLVLNYRGPEVGFVQVAKVNPAGELLFAEDVVWADGTTRVPSDGSSCGPGEAFRGETLSCEACPVGHFASAAGFATCKPCPAGFVCNREGCQFCSDCPPGSYIDTEGGTECIACPEGTSSGQAASNLSDCSCQKGFYRRDAAPGLECYRCPEGGVCDGVGHLPYPGEGFWGDWSLVDLSAPDSREAAGRIRESVFHACEGDVCGNGCGVAPDPDTGAFHSVFEQAAYRECRARPENVCAEGTMGRMCHTCVAGYFSLGSQCVRCRDPKHLFVFGCLACILVMWVVLNTVVSMDYDAMDLALVYLQITSVIASFSLDWHQWLTVYPFRLVALADFDVTFFQPDCLDTADYDAWDYRSGLLLQLILPIIVLFMYIFVYLLNLAVVRIVLRAAGGGDGEGGVSAVQLERDVRLRVFMQVVRLCHLADSEAALEVLFDKFVGYTTSFLNVGYNTVTVASLSVFHCTELPDGTSFLNVSPAVLCWEGAHNGYIVGAVFGLLAYTFGVPAFFYTILNTGRGRGLFTDERFQRRFGWLYMRFESDFYWWELVLLSRRMLFCFILVLMQEVPILQASAGVLAVMYCLCMHFYARPFISTTIDILDSFGLVSLMGLLCTGLLFYDDFAKLKFGGWNNSVLAVTVVFMFSCTLAVIFLTFMDVRKVVLIRRTMFVFTAVGRVLRRGSHATQDLVDASRAPLELHETLDPICLSLWVASLEKRTTKKNGGRNDLIGAGGSGRHQVAPAPARGALAGAVSEAVSGADVDADADVDVETIDVETGQLQAGRASPGLPFPPPNSAPVTAFAFTDESSSQELVDSEGRSRVPASSILSSVGTPLSTFTSMDTPRGGDERYHRHSELYYSKSMESMGTTMSLSEESRSDQGGSGIMWRISKALDMVGSDVHGEEKEKKRAVRRARRIIHHNRVLAEKYIRCNAWLAGVVSDDSEVSYYSGGPLATFFGDVCHTMPYIVSYLFECSEEERRFAKSFIMMLQQVYERYELAKPGRFIANGTDIDNVKGRKSPEEPKKYVRYEELINEIDRAAVCYWLLQAPKYQVEEFRDVLASVWHASGKGKED